jgi:hypothetical protein
LPAKKPKLCKLRLEADALLHKPENLGRCNEFWTNSPSIPTKNAQNHSAIMQRAAEADCSQTSLSRAYGASVWMRLGSVSATCEFPKADTTMVTRCK